MVKRTSAIEEEGQGCGTTSTHKAIPNHQPTHVQDVPAILTATVPSSPNYGLVELKLQQMGLLVTRTQQVVSLPGPKQASASPQ